MDRLEALRHLRMNGHNAFVSPLLGHEIAQAFDVTPSDPQQIETPRGMPTKGYATVYLAELIGHELSARAANVGRKPNTAPLYRQLDSQAHPITRWSSLLVWISENVYLDRADAPDAHTLPLPFDPFDSRP